MKSTVDRIIDYIILFSPSECSVSFIHHAVRELFISTECPTWDIFLSVLETIFQVDLKEFYYV